MPRKLTKAERKAYRELARAARKVQALENKRRQNERSPQVKKCFKREVSHV